MRLLESKRYRDDLKKAISNTDLSELNNKSIFITGGLGLICSTIVDVLAYWVIMQQFMWVREVNNILGKGLVVSMQ